MTSISVFFPAYNDAPSIANLVEKAFRGAARAGLDFEVIVVNDGSTDGTADVLAGLEKRYGEAFRTVTHPENRGYGAALRSGFAAARKDFVFYTDGDGQYDVGELPKLLDRMEAGRRPGERIQARAQRSLAADRDRKYLQPFRAADFPHPSARYRLRLPADPAIAARRDHLSSTSGTICVELVRKLELSPYRVVEVGVHHYPRLHGSSQFFRFRSLMTTLYQLMQLYVRLVVAPAFTGKDRRLA